MLGSRLKRGNEEEETGGLEAKYLSTGTCQISCAHFTDGETEAEGVLDLSH